MGTIISTEKRDDDKVNVTVALTYREAMSLKGHMDNVAVVSDQNLLVESKISKRGNKEATQYFLIPRELRGNLRTDSIVKCQRIDLKEKTYFVFLVDQET
jgi:hypothetical protein